MNDRDWPRCSYVWRQSALSADTYENQIVKLFAHRVEEASRSLRRVQMGSVASEEVEALARRMQACRLTALFLDRVTLPKTPPQRLTMALLQVPEYRAALEGLLEFDRSVSVRLDEPKLLSPLEELPYLFQRWCTLCVLATLVEASTSAGFRVDSQRLFVRRGCEFYLRVVPDGVPLLRLRRSDGARISLTSERTFSSAGQLRSTSFPQRPDISIEFVGASGVASLLLLDPKYKLDSAPKPSWSGPCKADIDKMHAYRDAIRQTNGQRAVHLAAILYPGPYRWFGETVAALEATPSTIVGSCRAAIDKWLLKCGDVPISGDAGGRD